MPENINRKKEEVISRETAGKIPWKYLTIVLAGVLLLGAVYMIANSLVTQTPAKTSTDLMNNPDKSGGDKAPPAVNGSSITPSPTINKGQEFGVFRSEKWFKVSSDAQEFEISRGDINFKLKILAISDKVAIIHNEIISLPKDSEVEVIIRFKEGRDPIVMDLYLRSYAQLSPPMGLNTEWQPEIRVVKRMENIPAPHSNVLN